MQYTLNGQSFDLPELNRTGGPSDAVASFHKALDASNSYATAKHQINGDLALSSIGKLAKLIPLKKALWQQLASSAKAVYAARRDVETRTAALYETGAPMTPYEIAVDREIRDWWRQADTEAKNAFRHSLADGMADKKMILALLRSPVPAVLDLEMRLLREKFEELQREAAPDIWAAIEDDAAATNWAERGLAHVIAISHALTETTAGELLKMLVAADDFAAAVAFGFAPAQFANEKRLAAAKVAY